MNFMPVILWSDALVFLLLAAGIACAWYVRRHEALLLPWRRVAIGYPALSRGITGKERRCNGVYTGSAERVRQAGGAAAHAHRENLFRAAGDHALHQGEHHRRAGQCRARLSEVALWRRASGRCATA